MTDLNWLFFKNIYLFQFQNAIDDMSETEVRELLGSVVEQHPGLLFNILEVTSGHDGGYHPEPGDAPDWCVCGHCRPMPTPAENVCCGMSPANCVSLLPVSCTSCYVTYPQHKNPQPKKLI